MSLNTLTKTKTKSKKRVGRGYGSGKGGHTSGRGAKGQKARGKVPLYFEGTPMRKSLIRRIPMLRGKLKNKSVKVKPIIINLKHLAGFKKNQTVSVKTLIKNKILPVKVKGLPVKILGDGDLKVALNVALPVSKSAAKKIKKAGGKITSITPKKKKVHPRRKGETLKEKHAPKKKKKKVHPRRKGETLTGDTRESRVGTAKPEGVTLKGTSGASKKKKKSSQKIT
ncbi:MAG: 50S ribosomal protein L15 [Patescibacteria group bacterium]|nr:50S ribosomal protein L15 [Patescibacteria group bacterium]